MPGFVEGGRGARAGDRALWGVFGASVAAVLLTLVTSWAMAPRAPQGAGPLYPRIRMPPGGGPGELLQWLGIGSLTWYACILSAPLFVLLARRLPLVRRRFGLAFAVHAAVIGGLLLATAALQHAASYAGAPVAPPLGDYLRVTVLTGTLPFVAVAAAAHAFEARSQARERELEAARMRGQLAEARLEALTGRLQPHFLFNTLQGISTLIHHEPATADRMLTRLSDLLREVLKRGERQEVPLGEELDVLSPYLDIAALRFGPRISVELDIDDDARGALVPFFILQPLVENALEHGAGARSDPGHVRIVARRTGERLLLTVTDDGVGLFAETPRRGIGLETTRARLREIHGPAAELRLQSPPEGGLQVTVDLPFARQTEAAEVP